jgi:hypothetical protein
VRQRSAQRSLRQRVIALAAAYAVALASLVASYGLARAAGSPVAAPVDVICHTVLPGDQAPAPASDQTDHCVDNCCLGCIMLLAGLPAPPANRAELPKFSGEYLAPPAQIVLARRPETTSHQSRGPPSAA